MQLLVHTLSLARKVQTSFVLLNDATFITGLLFNLHVICLVSIGFASTMQNNWTVFPLVVVYKLLLVLTIGGSNLKKKEIQLKTYANNIRLNIYISRLV